MLRFGHAMSDFYLILSVFRLFVVRSLRAVFAGYAMGGQLRARALVKPQVASGNCLTYVLAQRLRHGGRIIYIKSLYGWWCHAYWLSQSGDVFEYAPAQPHRQVKKLWHPLPPLVYSGRERLAPKLPPRALRKVRALMQPRIVELTLPTPTVTAKAQPAVIRAAA